jgi:hypothetical protein
MTKRYTCGGGMRRVDAGQSWHGTSRPVNLEKGWRRVRRYTKDESPISVTLTSLDLGDCAIINNVNIPTAGGAVNQEVLSSRA